MGQYKYPTLRALRKAFRPFSRPTMSYYRDAPGYGTQQVRRLRIPW